MIKKTIIFSFIFISIAIIGRDRLAWADGLEDKGEIEATIKAPPPPLIAEDISMPQNEEADNVEKTVKEDLDLWPAISQGMIILNPQADGEITASEDPKQMLGRGDTVYLSSYNELFSPQQESIIFKSIKQVHHPETGVLLGDLVDVLGIVRVNEVGEDVSTGKIIVSKNPISKTDKIASIDRFIPPPPQIILFPKEGTEAMIVEVRDDRKSIGQHDIVYIDKGSEEGILPGDNFVIAHGGERTSLRTKNDTQKLPEGISIPYREIGKIVILATQEHTATGKIISSSEEISKGDTILYLSQEETTIQ
ncbi:hypothetical protein JYT87_04005 [Nitrospira defluvii]|nr:hypothetical protein [Nitrospira defluvii]